MSDLAELKGKTLEHIHVDTDEDIILLVTTDGWTYKLYHLLQCCESVTIEDICGDVDDLLGHPLLTVEERTNSDNPKPNSDEYTTWTFYELATIKGSVTIRWYGESSGYYSESVDCEKYRTTGDR